MSELKLPESVKQMYLSRYSKVAYVEIVEKYNSLDEVAKRSGIVTFLIEINFKNMICTVDDQMISYGENELVVQSYKARYLWVLFWWFDLGRFPDGIS